MKFESAYPTLKLFIEKSIKLENSLFVKSIKKEFRLGFNLEVGKEMKVTSIRPQQEEIDAFSLTYRFFIQDNEAISIRRLQEIFSSKLVTVEEKKKYNTIRKNLNSFLSESANLVFKEENLSHRVIMETVLYGELSHANRDKKQKFDTWMDSTELFSEAIWHKFIDIIFTALHAIKCIKTILEDVISRNESGANN